ncbi:Calx-beta domain-containing protein [Nodularia spumigena]|uniref:Calx-beta domain-containing protein n=1 Tax=Nodularia spumigena TaxID=70799 RepID=UPI00232F659F|nr:Calx-beta domain-containing protein [Nodularia spumigena]MDB9318199.1 Calx-beta domain-containing protein [Nodularia spumigena CS-590/01A]MDB9328024.1 Calx-beta domain-containing protein [Nodularia spumigena CS-590/02]MDB9334309.1 Calx-beta domain-containing protein [Nodularia spumigena CS-590/01]
MEATTVSTGILQFTKPTYKITESGSWIGDAIAVSRTGGSSGVASVKVTSRTESATIGRDLGRVSVLLTWEDGEEGEKYVPVSVVQDAYEEEDESVLLSLGSIKGAKYAPVKTAQLIIVDREHQAIAINSINDNTLISLVPTPGGARGIKFGDIKSLILQGISSTPTPPTPPAPTIYGVGVSGNEVIFSRQFINQGVYASTGNRNVADGTILGDASLTFDGFSKLSLLDDPELNKNIDYRVSLDLWNLSSSFSILFRLGNLTIGMGQGFIEFATSLDNWITKNSRDRIIPANQWANFILEKIGNLHTIKINGVLVVMNDGLSSIEYAENYFNGNFYLGGNESGQFFYGNVANFNLEIL